MNTVAKIDPTQARPAHVDPAEWEIAMGPGGALEAAIQAREDGLVRFIGVTGHDVPVAKMHIRSLGSISRPATGWSITTA